MKELISGEAADLQGETLVDFFYNLCKEAGEDMNRAELVPLERMIYLSRMAYLQGFTKATIIFNEAIKDGETDEQREQEE